MVCLYHDNIVCICSVVTGVKITLHTSEFLLQWRVLLLECSLIADLFNPL